MVDHSTLIGHLSSVGFSWKSSWGDCKLFQRQNPLCPDWLYILSQRYCKLQMGVPQGSVPGPLLLTIHINNAGQNVPNSAFHFYADDTCHFWVFTACFRVGSRTTCGQFNADKTKLMFFITSKKARSAPSENAVTRNGWQIELPSTFKSLLWST